MLLMIILAKDDVTFYSSGARSMLPMGVAIEAMIGCSQPIIGSQFEFFDLICRTQNYVFFPKIMMSLLTKMIIMSSSSRRAVI
jgi:hypothetical protein